MELLIDTIPKDARNQGSINLGCEIVARRSGADVKGWWEKIDREYKSIGFNIFYPMHIINAFSFLLRNKVDPAKCRLVFGGQGVSNLRGFLSDFPCSVYGGEYDGDEVDANGWHRATMLESMPIIKNEKACIELTRGCRHRCYFCEYGWVSGGKYREKPIYLVKEQIDECVKKRVYAVNFLSANFGSYTEFDELIDYCKRRGVQILNRDICLKDIDRAWGWIENNKVEYLKVGIESFDEKTRSGINKEISDAQLHKIIDRVMRQCSSLHMYLIYGLPNDNYERWFDWVRMLGAKRKEYTRLENDLFEPQLVNTKNIRFEMSITNFEPCIGTPLADAEQVNFLAKDAFLKDWFNVMVEAGFYKGRSELSYGTGRGRLGRKELSYKMLMAIKHGKPKNIAKVMDAFPKGISRTVDDEQAEKFLEAME